jgi:hypothetical protein
MPAFALASSSSGLASRTPLSRGNGIAGFIRVVRTANTDMEVPPASRPRVWRSKRHGGSICRSAAWPISRNGAIKRHGRPRSIVVLIDTNTYRQTGALVADRGWKRSFYDPIPLLGGRRLVTMEDAGNYITKLAKVEHEAPEWQAAMEALILVVTLGGPTMFARIGVTRALNRHVERVFDRSRKDTHWGKRKLVRDR